MADENPPDRGQFISNWAFFPIAAASRLYYELGPPFSPMVEEFQKRADDFYNFVAKMYPVWRRLRPWVKKYIYFWAAPQEKAILSHPIGKQLFELWLEHIGGRKYGIRADIEEKIGFFKYLFMNLNIAHSPAMKQKCTDYQSLNFSLKMLRPNVEAHIYITQTFKVRPITSMIRQYLEMAIITGDYELILRRFAPYHNILWIHSSPGDRTSLDTRQGFDLSIIYKLPIKYNVALELDKVQTRSNNRFITCTAVEDPKLEQEKQAEVDKMQKELDATFPNPFFMGGVDFRDGKVWSGDQEVFAFGPKRQRYMQVLSEMNLTKGNPRPGLDSSLILRFQLLHPVNVLLEGINRKREISLEEVEIAWKVLDIQGGEFNKPEDKKRSISQIIGEVFDNPHQPLPGVKPDTLSMLREIKRLRNDVSPEETDEINENAEAEIRKLGEKISEEKIRKIRKTAKGKIQWLYKEAEDRAWAYLIERLMEGKAKPLLHALCMRLITDGFDVVFSLWPLLTGKDLSISESGEIQISGTESEEIKESRENRNDVRKVEKKKQISKMKRSKNGESKTKTVLPLIDFPKADLEDLLKNIFNKYLDISAATTRARSEPRLAAMIVEYCLKAKSNPYTFREKLTRHLKEHYEIHYNFLEEYIKSDKYRDENPTVLKHIHKLKLRPATPADQGKKIEPNAYTIDWDQVGEQIEYDVENIIENIHTVRERLYSFTGSSRFLSFVDPLSVEVQIGDFYYEGKGLIEEEKFIAKQQELLYELSKAESSKRAEVEKFNIERKGNKQIALMKLAMLDGRRNLAEKEASTLRDIAEYELRKAFSEAKQQAIEKLKEGDISAYAKLSLIKAHYEGGIEAVEKILDQSPNLLRALAPEQYKMMKMGKIKEKLVGILKENPDQLDRVTVAMLLSQDFKDIVATDIHKDINTLFADIIKNVRYVMPTIPRMRETEGPLGERSLGYGKRSESEEVSGGSVEVMPDEEDAADEDIFENIISEH